MEDKARDARIVKISICIHKMYDAEYFIAKEVCKECSTSPLLIAMLAKYGHITSTAVGSTNQPVEPGTYVWSGLNPLENLAAFSTGMLELMLEYERKTNDRRREKRQAAKQQRKRYNDIVIEPTAHDDLRLLTVSDAINIAKAVKKWDINEIENFVKDYVKEKA